MGFGGLTKSKREDTEDYAIPDLEYTATGEYWITPDDVIFCDGDAGVDVPNHAMVVVLQCAVNFADRLREVETSKLADNIAGVIEQVIGEYQVVDCVMLRTEINDSIDRWVEEGLLTLDQSDDIYAFIRGLLGIKKGSLEDQEIDAALGQHDDPREIGVRWGWVRVAGANFYCRDLSPATCRLMADFAAESPNKSWMVEWVEHGRRVYAAGVSTSSLERVSSIRRQRSRI